jgi:hypothetical protein
MRPKRHTKISCYFLRSCPRLPAAAPGGPVMVLAMAGLVTAVDRARLRQSRSARFHPDTATPGPLSRAA